MKGLQYLKSALVGGASVLALVHPVAAKMFDVPESDLAAALVAYMKQSNVEIIYADDVVRGHKSRGVKGDYTETAALTQILRGTGLATQTMSPNAIGIVAQRPAPVGRLAQAAPRRAPAAPMPAAPATIETVVVTAQHKTENIQQVPIAVTALSQQQLTERQIAGGPDLVKEVPNLTFSKTNFSGYNLEIRGIGTQAISVTTDPAVAVAFNGIPFIRNHFFEQEFFDLDNLEVLRGPQGTLYGRNATAGVVNIISALPTDTYEAMLSADIGNYSNRRYEGMLNLPIVGDTLDLRIAGEWTKRDGYTEDTTLNTSVDGRDLWSGRMTIGWKPASNVQTYLVWEHFSEDDNRLRSGKQLCKTAPAFENLSGGDYGAAGNYLSQGCEDTSLYSPSAFEVPDGHSLTYYAPLADAGAPTQGSFDVYAETTQSTNLRQIQSALLPTYRAKNDTLEWNTNWQVNSGLTFTSQTGYNNDFLWSMEDYDRFDSAPGAFTYSSIEQNGVTLPDPAAGKNGVPANAGIFCDPQLGCSDRLVLEDLSDEHAWQFSQEFRLASNFSGPLNFSVGGNFLHYETEENYYVFINSITSLSTANAGSGVPWIPGVTDNSQCLKGGLRTINPADRASVLGSCWYVDPNPISSLNNEGHNYFLSQNPYVLNSYAGFGEAYYNLTNDLKLTAGARWTDDQKHFLDIPSELLDPGYGYPVTGVVNQQWDRWTGRFVADWTPQLDFTDQTLIYASAAHGYKAGGANPPGAFFPLTEFESAGFGVVTNPIHPLTFKPEYIEAFELGTKNTLLGGALTLNGDIFYYNYTGYQISEIVDRTAINNNYNAHVEGAEFEGNWEPLPGLKFSLAQGFESTALAGGDQGIDLMDRTAGMPGWVVVRPYPTTASNCILPGYVINAIIAVGGVSDGGENFYNACNFTYTKDVDPVTGLPYVPNPTVTISDQNGFGGGTPLPAGYPGFNPNALVNGQSINNGEGFDKKLGGNQLPNAPHFTTSLTAEYTMPVSDDWAATLHGDFYWQSQQWARVFEDAIDKIHGYSTTNVSLILTSDNGWQVMGYVKNVFNVTAITGTFLNSDDTGLTTNVFLTDPRLYGIRVTKHLDDNDGFWGSQYSGSDFFTGLFSDTDNGKPPLWIELGTDFDALSDSSQTFAPPFLSTYAPNGLKSPLFTEQAPHYGFDEDVKVSFQPDGSDWVFSAQVKYGRMAADKKLHQQFKNPYAYIDKNTFVFGTHHLPYGGYAFYPTGHVKFADASAQQSEAHTVMDFETGKDVGLGMFGLPGSSVVSAGVRVAQFLSKSNIDINAQPDVQYPSGPLANSAAKYTYHHTKMHLHNYNATETDKESFHGLGPKLDWNASTPVAGNEQDGEVTFDWGANLAVLFGRQKASGSHQSGVKSYYLSSWQPSFPNGEGTANGNKPVRGNFWDPAFCPPTTGERCEKNPRPTNQHTNAPQAHRRSRMVAVPNLGGFLGISMKYNNAKVSFGYRADEFFGAMDGGIDTYKSENRGFNGPYATLSIGLGG
jgi:iron complex outermembrane receptor protein